MPRLSISLFGTFEVALAGTPVTTFESDKVRALLAYLAVEADHPHRRETLAGLLWPERPERNARQSLSQALFNLRQATGDREATPPFFIASAQTLQFNRSSDYKLDVMGFTRLLTACQEHKHNGLDACQPCLDRLEQAAALYWGNFLEGFSLGDSVAFEEWSVLNRERFHHLAVQTLGHLAGCYERRGEYEPALRHTRRQIELDPYSEEPHQQLMRLLALDGQRGAALAQYETCRHLLAAEIGVKPAAETRGLYEQIQAGTLAGMGAGERVSFLHPHTSAPPLPYAATTPPPPTPTASFVARERELARLDQFLNTALSGQGQVVFVTGGAGRGKTALMQAFAHRVQATHPDLIVAGGNGNAHTGLGDPYLPFREVLALLTGDVEAKYAAGAISRDHATRLWQLLPLSGQTLLDDSPDLIETFLPGAGLVRRAAAFSRSSGEAEWPARLEELVERKAALPADPNLQPQALFEQYSRLLRVLAGQVPLLLLLDDLQWADPGSTSLLFHLGRQLEGSRIMVVGAYRPDEVALGRPSTSPGHDPTVNPEQRERHPLEPVVNEFKRCFGDIEVDLAQTEERQFVDVLLDAEPNRLNDTFRQTLYRQTGGHPLFTIELLRGMQERGDLVQDQQGRWIEGPVLDWETLPARVEAVIAERIERLPERLQEALTVACVEGETFTVEVAARLGPVDERETVRWFSNRLERGYRLVNAQGIRHLSPGGQRLSQYRFRHILFQRYLYNRLDQVERAHLHQAVGTALEALYGENTAEIAVQLARHFQEAGAVRKAIVYLRQAGERAVRLSANEEAITHLRRGLELLETMPDTPERAQEELALQVALAVPLQAAKGFAAPEVGHTFARTRELCRQVGETPQIFPVLWLLALFYGTRGEHQTAHELAEQLLNLAERVGDPVLVALAHYMLGSAALFIGKLTLAQDYLEQVIAFYDPQEHDTLIFHYGLDIGVSGLSFASLAFWLLGYPDQALKRSQEALALAQGLDHPLALGLALGGAGILFHQFRRNAQVTQEWAEALISLSIEQGFPYWLAMGICNRGWALVEQGQVKEGIEQMRQGTTGYQATGAAVVLSQQLAMLAEAYGKIGLIEEGLTTFAKALAIAYRNEDRLYEAEIHRLKGELLQQAEGRELHTSHESPEACFLKAIEVARAQQAKSWELRATVSLCRLWQHQGRTAEAQQMLEEIYGWFTEGFDTVDLKEAKALLEALA